MATSLHFQQLVGTLVLHPVRALLGLCGADYVILPPLPMYICSHNADAATSSLRPILFLTEKAYLLPNWRSEPTPSHSPVLKALNVDSRQAWPYAPLASDAARTNTCERRCETRKFILAHDAILRRSDVQPMQPETGGTRFRPAAAPARSIVSR